MPKALEEILQMLLGNGWRQVLVIEGQSDHGILFVHLRLVMGSDCPDERLIGAAGHALAAGKIDRAGEGGHPISDRLKRDGPFGAIIE